MRFEHNPGLREEFRRLNALGSGLARNPELGVRLLEKHRARILGSSWYQLRHFTSLTLVKALEQAGFTEVRVSYGVSTLARHVWPHVSESRLAGQQAIDLLRGLADLALELPAPLGAGEPVVATKPR